MENKIVYTYYFGQETYGKVVFENDKYQCYETPLFGGECMKVGEPFKHKETAITYLKNLT